MADPRPWARALHLAAGAAGVRASVGGALARAAAALEGEPAFRSFLDDPAVPEAGKVAALAAFHTAPAAGEAGGAAGGEAGGAALFARFAALLARKGGFGALRDIARLWRGLEDAEAGLLRVEVASARPLPGDAVLRLARAFARSEGAADAIPETRIDPRLLGGFTVRGGPVRYDRSVAGRLERLRRHMSGPLPPAGGYDGTGA